MIVRTVIADDEPLARERLRMLLAADREIEIAAECRSGGEVVTALREGKADLLFLDIQMPEMTGLEVLARLRATGSQPKVKVIIMTADGTPESLLHAVREQAY